MTARAELVEKLTSLVAWLDSCPPRGDQYRSLIIEIGVEQDVRATVNLHAYWVCRPRPGQTVDNAPTGERTHYAEGPTVEAALRALHVPRPTRRRKGARR